MARILVHRAVLILLVALAACTPDRPEPAAPQGVAVFVPPPSVDTPPAMIEAPSKAEPNATALPSTATAPEMGGDNTGPAIAAEHVDDALTTAVESLGIEPRPPAPTPPLLSPAAFDLLVSFEAGGRRAYDRKYKRPVWPGGSSGATIGIGYDLGHTTKAVILADWATHPQRDALPAGAGVTGRAARPVTAQMQHVVTEFQLAEDVFNAASSVTYWRQTRRAFGPGIDNLRWNAQGALFLLVYNRGGGMQGDKRREMRVMRDTCIPAQDYACLAGQMRAMKRVWRGTDIELGMSRRREAEAVLIETP